MSLVRRGMQLVCCLVLVGGLSGCFAGFHLTQKVYQFNDDVSENKWVDEVVFLGLNIVPVYGLATFADAIVFNSIEFWTGKNVISLDDDEMIEE